MAVLATNANITAHIGRARGDDTAPKRKLLLVKHERNQFSLNVAFGEEGGRRRDATSWKKVLDKKPGTGVILMEEAIPVGRST